MTPEDPEVVVVRRRIAAPPEVLFDAWTDPEGMRNWMCPGSIVSAEVELDPRPGGRLRVVMRDAEKSYEHLGEFLAVERPRKLVFSWSAAATLMRTTQVSVEFLPLGPDLTEVVVTHTSLPSREVRDRYQGGWAGILEKLALHVRA